MSGDKGLGPRGTGTGGPPSPPPPARRLPRHWGTPAAAAAMLLAAVLGAGTALTAIALTAPPSAATAPAPALRVGKAPDANVDAAAAKASSSVVTVAVSSPGSSGTGSGVVLDGEGHILTNTHVVTLDGAAAHPTVQVQAPDGHVYPATVVGTDPLSDLAVIQVRAQGAHLAPIAFGDPGAVNVGDTVAAIGAPLGLEGTVTSGIVSALHRTISVASSAAPQGGDQQQGGSPGFRFAQPNGSPLQPPTARGTVSFHAIQTDAPINPGNSGGALVDDQGRLVGINVAIASTGTPSAGAGAGKSGSIGIGFSIPADYARRIAGELIDHGAAAHGLLGVTVRPAAPADAPGSPFPVGAQVARVAPGSPAQQAGIRAGDVITRFGDYPVHSPQGLTAAVHEQPPGTAATIALTRAGRPLTVHATLATAP